MGKKAARLLLVASMAGGLTVGGATAAFARDVCTGTYEIDGCEYCAYSNGSTHQSSYRCDQNWTNYSWQRCGLWVNNSCIQGTFVLQNAG